MDMNEKHGNTYLWMIFDLCIVSFNSAQFQTQTYSPAKKNVLNDNNQRNYISLAWSDFYFEHIKTQIIPQKIKKIKTRGNQVSKKRGKLEMVKL